MISDTFIERSRYYLATEYATKIRLSVRALSYEQIWERPNEQSNSIGNLLLHLAGNVRQWIVCGVGGAFDERVRQQEFDERSLIPKAELLAKLKQTLAEVDVTLAEFDPAGILEPRCIQGYEVSVLDAVFHVV